MLLLFQNLLRIPTNFPPLWDFKIMIRPNGRTQLTPLVKNWKGKLQAWDQGCTGCLIPTDLGLPDIPSTLWEPSLLSPVSKIWIILFFRLEPVCRFQLTYEWKGFCADTQLNFWYKYYKMLFDNLINKLFLFLNCWV